MSRTFAAVTAVGLLVAGSPLAVASVPVSMVIPPGSGAGTFTVSTVPVAQTSTVTLSGSVGGVASDPVKNPVLTVEAPRLDRFEVVPGSVIGGQSSEGRVSLNGPAPPGGVTVQLSSSNTAPATVPATLTIPQGEVRGTFTISTVPITQVSQTRLVTITARVGGVTMSAPVTVVPPGP